jgi:uncharacterized Zn finger protein
VKPRRCAACARDTAHVLRHEPAHITIACAECGCIERTIDYLTAWTNLTRMLKETEADDERENNAN